LGFDTNSGGTAVLIRFDNGVETILWSLQGTGTDPFTVTLDATGSTLTFSVAGFGVVTSEVDATYSSGKVGFTLWRNGRTTATLDDLVVTGVAEATGPITFVGAGSQASGTGAVTPGMPAGATDGDLLLCHIEGEGEDGSADAMTDTG